jgi:PAS domain S-box-containing protein
MTHWMEVWTIWNATYWLSGYVKLVTAVASVATAVVLPPLVPKTLELLRAAKLSEARRTHLETANEELAHLREREHQHAQAELAESRRILETLANNATLALFIMDARQHCLYMNPAAERLTGYTLAEVQGQPLHNFVHHTHPDGTPYPLEECPIDRALPQNNREQGREVFVHKDGTFYPVAFTASPIREGSVPTGTIIEVKAIAEELRAEKERERMLEREKALRAEAEEANRLKEEFLATVSHELRTPLTAIIGWAHMLEQNFLDQQATRHAVSVIRRNADQQKQIVEDILDVSSVITGKLKLNFQPVEVSPIIEDALDTVRPAAEAKNILLLSNHVAGAMVVGDPHRLQQVMWNLLANAVKFTHTGGEVRVEVSRLDTHIRIRVSDTGQGIDADFLPFVFDRFRQADSSTTRHHGGLGLGLAIVRHLVELHGGSVQAESAGEGQGATFTVKLPLYDETEATTAPATTDAETSAIEETTAEEPHASPVPTRADVGGEERTRTLAGVRALLVDDDEDTLDMLSMFLRHAGAEVLAVSSASAALEALPRVRPDVIVADIGMPDADGHELMRRVRALDASQGGHTPALALTAYAGEADRLQALRSGFQAHLAKPVEPETLVAAIIDLAGRAGT